MRLSLLLLACATLLAATDPDGSTPLLWASYHDDAAAVDRLIRAGADVNAANDLGVTPLWAACQNGDLTIVRRLLQAGANPNMALLSGETPLMVAARSGYSEIVDLLSAKGVNPNARGTRGQTALMWAVAEKHPEVVRVLVAHGAGIAARSEVWSEVMAVPPHGYLPYNRAIPHGGETALLFAARVGDLESAKLLLAAGANVNDADAWGVTATTLAAHSDFREIVAFLLEKGADPNLAKSGFSALHDAIMWRDEQMVSALLDHGADPNATLRTWTPTRRSSHDWHFEPSLVGASPFWLASRFDEPNIMRLLVKHGADPLFVHHAESIGDKGFQKRTEVTNALMAATGMGGGTTSWSSAPKSQREALMLETVKLTAELGADINAVNSDGRTALDAAKSLHYESVMKFLTEKGARSGRPGKAPEPATEQN